MSGKIDHQDSPNSETVNTDVQEKQTEIKPELEFEEVTIEDGGQTWGNTNSTITVKFQDVKYKVELEQRSGSWWSPVKSMKKEEREILHGITGSVEAGEMLAMLGPSGSGKTTLLNVLGGRLKHSSGSVTYNDVPYSKALKRKLGFVTQDDHFYPHLTVRETLMYAALLRLPKELTQNQKLQRADAIINDLGLERCKNTIIGGPFLRGVSGGERKRVSIGHEILIDPSLLLLDEPTSGLDSTTALKIIQVLQRIAAAGRTVITTIHQPSSRLFHSFDKLLLICEGDPIYFGEAKTALNYFEKIGFSPLLAMNPADFLLDLATGTSSDINVPDSLSKNPKWIANPLMQKQKEVRMYLARAHDEQLLPDIQSTMAKIPPASESARLEIHRKREWNATWIQQFVILCQRGFKERRHEYLSSLRFVQVIAISFICGLLWFDSKLDSAESVQDQVGFLFFIAIFWSFFPLFTAIFTFPQERMMLTKERASDMYQLSSYFMSRTLSDLPMEFILPIIFLIITYFMANLKSNVVNFFVLLLSILLNVSVAQGLGFAIGAAVLDVKKATTLASIIVLTFMLVGGYYVQKLPVFIKWLKYVAFTYWSYRLTMKTQYSDEQTYPCDNRNVCYVKDSAMIRQFALKNAWVDAIVLIGMLFFFRLLAYLALRRMKISL